MEKQRISQSWLTKNVLGFSIASLFSDSSHEIVPLVLPTLLIGLVGSQAAPSYVGFISGFATVAASIAVLFSGWLSDKMINRKPLLLLGYSLMCICVGLVGFAHSWYTVFLFMSLAWIGRGLSSAPRNAIIADSINPAFYGHAFGFRQAFDTLGSVIGPILVYFLSGVPVSTLFLVSFIPGMLAFLTITLFIFDVPHRILAKRSFLNLEELTPQFYVLVAIFILFGLGNFNKTLLVLRMQNSLSGSQATTLSLITLLYIFRNIVQTMSAYFMGAISDKIGRKLPLAIGGFALFGAMSLGLTYQSPSLLFMLLIFFLSGFSAGTYTTLQKTMAADLLPESARGTGYGILQITNSFADLISSIIVGFLWSTYGAEIGFIFAAIMSFLAATLLFIRAH